MIEKTANKNLVCHLGAHKTATSLIQHYFKEKQNDFLAQGVLFYTRGEVSPFIGWGKEITKRGEKLADFIEKGFSYKDVDTVGISNENALGRPIKQGAKFLYPLHGEIANTLARLFSTYRTKVVFYIRPQVDYVPSYYLQLIHQGKYFTWDQYLDMIDLEKLSWRPLLEGLARAFGEKNFYLGDFNTIKDGQQKFLEDFVTTLLPPRVKDNYNYKRLHNPSISARGLHMALRINPLLKAGETRIVRKFLQSHFSNASEPRPVLVSEETRKRLTDLYSKEYEELLEKFQPVSPLGTRKAAANSPSHEAAI